jgi:CHASE2 domain-containing sensor protein
MQSARERWQRLSQHSRHLIINCVLGLTVVLVVHAAQERGVFTTQVDRGFDLMLQLQAGRDRANVPPFVFLDIDSDTHIAWGEPMYTPREKLARLLDYSLGSDALAVLLDIDLNLPVDNSEVEAVLKRYARSDHIHPPLVLVKTFRERSSQSPGEPRLLRPSSLDQLVTSTPGYHWASPLFEASGDFILRRWTQWVAGCAGQTPVLVPSSQLLMIAVTEDPAATALHQSIADILPDDCIDWPRARNRMLGGSVRAGFHDIHWRSSDLQRLILFNLPWVPTSDMPTTTISRNGRLIESKAVNIVPARLITESAKMPDDQLLEGHFVIIGNSSQFAGDLHATPLGQMPGSLVIINAIESLFAAGEVDPPALWIILLIELALLIVISLLFTHYNPGVAALLSGVFIVLIVFPASAQFFRYGVWLDFTLPLIAVQLHELIAIAETKFKSRRKMLNENSV